jgi:hypothetical protein
VPRGILLIEADLHVGRNRNIHHFGIGELQKIVNRFHLWARPESALLEPCLDLPLKPALPF